jgi:hypothetical protein
MTSHPRPNEDPQPNEDRQPEEDPRPNEALPIVGIVVVSISVMVVTLQGGPVLLLQALGVVLVVLGVRLYRARRV